MPVAHQDGIRIFVTWNVAQAVLRSTPSYVFTGRPTRISNLCCIYVRRLFRTASFVKYSTWRKVGSRGIVIGNFAPHAVCRKS